MVMEIERKREVHSVPELELERRSRHDGPLPLPLPTSQSVTTHRVPNIAQTSFGAGKHSSVESGKAIDEQRFCVGLL
jgi:hypothetical protein